MPTADQLQRAILLSLALAGFLFGLYQWHAARRTRPPSVTTRLHVGYWTYGPKLSECMLLIEVASGEVKPVRITALELELDRTVIWFTGGIEGTVSLPFDVVTGQPATFWIPLAEVQRELLGKGFRRTIDLRATARDVFGNAHSSRECVVELERNYN